ncbi:MAG: permease prefix domain 1-containing protein [Oscillospiraceae bacterium]|nr:permease prefix domain 1-containing protein [Oscillospiraceae bacterium]
MKKAEYIEKVLEQVRCKSVHEPLKKELEAHIEDQAEAFVNVGLPEAEAEEEAVKTMGDAIETGVGLDTVHRPKFPMSAALVAMLLMAVGLAARTFVCKDFFFYSANYLYEAISIPLAIVAMAVCYFMDYTVFTKFPKIAYGVFFCILTGAVMLRGNSSIELTGNFTSERTAAGRILLFGIMLLTPFMCGFVWSMRGKGFGGFVISCLVLVIPAAFVALCIPCVSAAVLAGISALAIMTYAVKNDFFRVKKNLAYRFIYIPAGIAAFLLAGLKIFIEPGFIHWVVSKPHYMLEGDYNADHQYSFVFISYNGNWEFLSILKDAHWFGSCIDINLNSYIPDPHYHYLILAIVLRLGWAAGIAASILLLALPVLMLVKSAKIKNIFGRMTALSASIVFLFVTVSYVLANLGITAEISSVCIPPFMAASPLNAVSSGALLGIFMSAYGKKDIFPERKLEIRTNTAIKG